MDFVCSENLCHFYFLFLDIVLYAKQSDTFPILFSFDVLITSVSNN